ncbi:oxygenase MpaB family protein [Fulvimarina sp. MAC3]|uniref:oxygenase MpaB family protein n=1 Tax=Fulvimarina sp. MAC3 TaxID=3148887 RepID=UPI0031FD4232
MSEQVAKRSSEEFALSVEKLMGSPSRWRRLGVPVAAGRRNHEDGTPDYGLFGPSSVVWKVLLHPATIIYQTPAQFSMQLMYKPVVAGVRDADPLATQVRAGTLTAFDSFNRFQRNSGLHAPMWFGDTRTAETMWAHLHALHDHVQGGLIDVGQPELGEYHADGPRDVMWAGLTEMMGMLWTYEHFAWHGDSPPQPLPDDERDQYVAESAAYLRLVGAPEAEIPQTMADVEALFGKYQELFKKTDTMYIMPDSGKDFSALAQQQIQKNWHPTQKMAVDVLDEFFNKPTNLVIASYPIYLQIWGAGWDDAKRAEMAENLKTAQPEIRARQESPDVERRAIDLFWGPDAHELISSARALMKRAN